MDKDQIKKELYKQKPIAELCFKNDDYYYYEAKLNGKTLLFKVPVLDMGETMFKVEEPAQLLIRYLVSND